MEFKDYYQILGVSPESDEKTIKNAYRRLARKYHPDVSDEPNAEEKFKSVNEANEVLGDATKRAEYDRLRAQGYRPGQEYTPPNWGGGFEGDFGGSGFSDFFESLFGGARGGRGHAHRAPAEVRAQVAVPLETVFSGGHQRIDVNGKTLEVKIPAGIAQGKNIRLKGQGGQGRDLLIEIQYQPHAVYELDGHHVIVRVPVSPWAAALGGAVQVPTLAGVVSLNIPAGSRTGQRLRLRGRGMPNGNSAGDQFAVIEIQAPTPSTDAQKQAYQALADAFNS